jgi:AcrR family transcriptional regulator
MVSPGKGRSHARADERRQALVKATYDAIAEKGLQGLRTREVAARVGLTHATLHYYFPTKQDLIDAVIKYAVFQRILIAGAIAPYAPHFEGETPREQLHLYLSNLQRSMEDDPTTYLVLSELLRHARYDDNIRDLFVRQEIFGSWHRALVALLESGISQGDFRADLDPQETASILMTFSLGLGTTILAPVPTPVADMLEQLEQLLAAM